jgi:CelD/BcsL family acetyltransferase involved in cellulose biosynthesis
MTIASVPRALDLGTISSLDEFEPLQRDWDALVRTMPRPSPFLLHGWLEQWWRSYGTSATLAVHVARREDRLVAALPLYVRSQLGLSVASFLGGGQSALADVLVGPGEAPEVATGLARRLTASSVDYVDLYGLPSASRLVAALPDSLEVIERVESPVLDLTEGWDSVYRAKTSSKRRNLHRRRRRQLGELGRIETVVARTPDELLPALDEAFRLHDLRWEGRPDGSAFSTPTGRTFHRSAMLALAELDVPRIVLLTLDRRAIAFQYFFVLEGRMYVHRLGFDPRLARLSPGLVNTLDAIEAAAAEGVGRVEFLGGAERYKLELADTFDPLCQAIGLARGQRARAVVAARLSIIRLRLRLKQEPALRRLYVDGLAPIRRFAARSRHALGV